MKYTIIVLLMIAQIYKNAQSKEFTKVEESAPVTETFAETQIEGERVFNLDIQTITDVWENHIKP